MMKKLIAIIALTLLACTLVVTCFASNIIYSTDENGNPIAIWYDKNGNEHRNGFGYIPEQEVTPIEPCQCGRTHKDGGAHVACCEEYPVECPVCGAFHYDLSRTEPPRHIKNKILGDVNDDDKVNVIDAGYLQQYLAGAVDDINKDNSDTTLDGRVTAQDALKLENIIVGVTQ